MEIKIKENSVLAWFAAKKLKCSQVAIVWKNTIHLHNTSKKDFLGNKSWVRHELKHVEQFSYYGTIPFVIRYLWESIKNGYYNNRFEVEARRAEVSELLVL
jgi:hypothetical protein